MIFTNIVMTCSFESLFRETTRGENDNVNRHTDSLSVLFPLWEKNSLRTGVFLNTCSLAAKKARECRGSNGSHEAEVHIPLSSWCASDRIRQWVEEMERDPRHHAFLKAQKDRLGGGCLRLHREECSDEAEITHMVEEHDLEMDA